MNIIKNYKAIKKEYLTIKSEYQKICKENNIKPFVKEYRNRQFKRWLLIIAGIFILPIAVFFRKPCENINKNSNQECFKWKWVDKIWGNKFDGFGDIYYYRTVKTDTFFSRYWWSAFRNTTHNYNLSQGISDKLIVKSSIYGNINVTDDPSPENTGLKIQIVRDKEGNDYKMFYYCRMWPQILNKDDDYDGEPKRGVRVLIGYKNFCVTSVNKKYTYAFTFVPHIFKLFMKG